MCRLHRLRQSVHRGLAQDSLPRSGQLLQALGQIDRVPDQGVLQALLRPEQGGGGLAGGQAHAQPERGEPLPLPAVVDLGLPAMGVGRRGQGPVGVVGLGERGPEHRHHRVAHELHDGAVLVQDGPVHGRPVGVELAGQLTGVGVFGDGGVRADVAHQHGDLDDLGLADVAAVPPQLLRQSTGEQSGQGLALLLPVHDALVEQPQPTDGPLGSRRDSLGQRHEERFDLGVDRLGGGALGRGDGLDGLALGHPAQQRLLGGRESAMGGDRADQGVDDGGVERRPPGGHRPHRVDQLVALGDVVLQQVAVTGRALGHQGDGVLGVVVLGQDDHAGTRAPLADLAGGLDPFPLEGGRHPDVGHQHMGLGGQDPLHQAVVVLGDPHHPQVTLPLEEATHPLADDHVVIGQEDVDDRSRTRRVVGFHDGSVIPHPRSTGQGVSTPTRGGASHTPVGGRSRWTRTVSGRQDGGMRTESSVTSLSWIPSEAVRGGTRVAFDAGFTHYDEPPPDVLEDIEALRKADRFRFANVLSAYLEADDDGAITDYGYTGGGLMGSTTVAVGILNKEFEAVALPVIQQPPEVGDGWVRFLQTAGGRTGLPAPRRVRRKPFIQWQSPLVWSTLSLTLHVGGPATFEVLGASRFPRHWFYDAEGKLAAKSGLTDFKDWYRKSFGKHTPWGDQDSPALVTAVETALERALSVQMMDKQSKPKFRQAVSRGHPVRRGRAGHGRLLGARRGDPGGEGRRADGRVRARARCSVSGPASRQGTRTSSLVAVTDSRVAVVAHTSMDREQLHELAKGHRSEKPQA